MLILLSHSLSHDFRKRRKRSNCLYVALQVRAERSEHRHIILIKPSRIHQFLPLNPFAARHFCLSSPRVHENILIARWAAILCV